MYRTAFLIAALAATGSTQTPTWEVEFLGAPDPAWSGVYATGVNDVGQVVGNTYLSGYRRAWIASAAGGVELLPIPTEATWSDVLEINSSGLAVGNVLVGGLSRAVVWTPGSSGYEYLLLPAGTGGVLPFDARGVNDLGDVVGKLGVLSGSYVWSASSGVVQIPTSAFPVVPEDINDQRQVIGDTFRMDLDTMVLEDLGNPTGTTYGYMYTKLAVINDAGECAGYAVTATSGWPYLPVRYSDGPVWQVFSNFPLISANALGLSACGDTVFQLGTFGTYVYVNGVGSILFESTPDPAFADWDLSSSFVPAISRGGLLGATGSNAVTGESGVVLLTPFAFDDLGGAARGSLGDPVLSGYGSLVSGQPARLRLASAAPNSIGLFAASGTSSPVPALGGMFHANPAIFTLGFPTDAFGRAETVFNWPSASPGAPMYVQAAVVDAEAAQLVSLSNALVGVTR
jgi:hypothetical protein